MSLRVKLLLLFTLAVAAAAGFTAWSAERYAARQFQQADEQRSSALAAQFRDELAEREAEVTTSIQTIADAESTVRMVLDLSRAGSDPSVYAGDARGLAAAHQLDFLELAGADGTVISSAQWRSHVGSQELWLTHENDWNQSGAFLDRVELPDHVELGLIAVRMVHAGNLNLYIVGGRSLDAGFLHTLSLPEGMRALLYRNLTTDFAPANLSDGEGVLADAESFEPLLDSMQKQPVNPDANGPQSVSWSPDSAGAERFVAVPLTGKQGQFLGALLLGSPQAALVAMKNYVRASALIAVAGGLILAFLLSWWIAARVSRPLARLTDGLGEVASGDWDARVEGGAVPEVLQAIGIFNKMTRQLTDERAGQVARERAAAWRQLAGQLAAELKTLLPPLQKAVEGLAQASPHDPETEGHALETQEGDDFADDIVPSLDSNSSAAGSVGISARRSAAADRLQPASSAMRQTLETLAACAGKLGEFASLPVPRLEPVNLNDAVRAAVQAFEPRFSAIGRPPITPELFLDEHVGPVRADAVLLRKALDNLLLFVLEDMPAGGTFTIHTRRQDDMAHMILAGSGSGLAAPRGQQGESRATMPDSVARVSGIGLSLATVQSIVSSHGGRISIESSPLAGTTFYLDWPVHGTAPPSNVPLFPAVLQNEVTQIQPPQNQKKPVARPAENAQPVAQPSQSAAHSSAAKPTIETAVPAEAAPEEIKSEEIKLAAPAEMALEHGVAAHRAESVSDSLAQAPAESVELALEPHPEPAPAPQAQPISQADGLPHLQTQPQPELQPFPADNVAASPPKLFDTPAQPALEPAIAEPILALAPQAEFEEAKLEAAKLEAEPPAPAELPAEISGQAPAQAADEPATQPELQLAVGTVEPAERDLAAVIEEVIETPRRSIFRNAQHFVRESDYSEESSEPETADFPMKETASGEVPGNLFGVPVPSAASATAAPTMVAPTPAPAEMRNGGPGNDAPAAPAFTLAEAESHLGNKPAAAEAPVTGNYEPAPHPAAAPNSQPSSQQSPSAPQDRDGQHHDDPNRPLTYSPLTYRW